MRISAINCVQNQHSYNKNNSKLNNPNFKSGAGSMGVIVGTAAGVGLTVLTGGAAAPLIPLMGFGGAVGGETVKEKIIDKKK